MELFLEKGALSILIKLLAAELLNFLLLLLSITSLEVSILLVKKISVCYIFRS